MLFNSLSILLAKRSESEIPSGLRFGGGGACEIWLAIDCGKDGVGDDASSSRGRMEGRMVETASSTARWRAAVGALEENGGCGLGAARGGSLEHDAAEERGGVGLGVDALSSLVALPPRYGERRSRFNGGEGVGLVGAVRCESVVNRMLVSIHKAYRLWIV